MLTGLERFLRRQVRRRPMWCLAALSLLVLLPGNAHMPLLDRDEPRFSRAAVEMLQADEWVIPTFNGQFRFDKPPLTYWLMFVNYTIFGQNEFGARLHSVLATLLIAVLIFRLAAPEIGRRSAFLASTIWITMVQVLMHGRVAVADMPMVACFFVSSVAIWKLLTDDERSRPWFYVLWISVGVGFLAKGPLAILLPALSLVLCRFVFRRSPLPIVAKLKPFRGLLIALGLVALWGIPALLATQGKYWDSGIGEHVVNRGLGAMNSRKFVPFVYYLASGLVSLWPWTPFVPGALTTAWKERKSLFVALLLSMVAAPYLIFALYATQLPHYVLPGFPALAILIALAMRTNRLPRVRKVMGGLQWGVVGVVVVGLIAADTNPVAIEVRKFGVAVVVILGSLILAARFSRRRQFTLMLASLLTLGIATEFVSRQANRFVLTRQVGDLVRSEVVDGEMIARHFAEPGLVFYADHSWTFVPQQAELPTLFEKDPAVLLIQTEEQRIEQILFPQVVEPDDGGEFAYPEIEIPEGYRLVEFSGINLARTTWCTLRVWIRTGRD